MKRSIFKTLAAALAAALALSACAGGETTPPPQPAPSEEAQAPTEQPPDDAQDDADPAGTTLVVGATAVPHAGILRLIVPDLSEQGITLEVDEFADYTLLNQALFENQIDANFFQHTPFLSDYVQNSGQDLVSLGNVHIEPMGIYSSKISNLNELTEGAEVGVPNDATNEGRALILLHENNIITLKDPTNFACTPADIVENPLNIHINELEASLLPRTLGELDIAVINTNYALEIGLNPVTDALVMEGADSPYANIVAVRGGDENRPELQALYAAITSDKVRDYLQETYGAAIVPAF